MSAHHERRKSKRGYPGSVHSAQLRNVTRRAVSSRNRAIRAFSTEIEEMNKAMLGSSLAAYQLNTTLRSHQLRDRG